MNDFDFLAGTWSVQHRRLKERLSGCDVWEAFDGTTVCRSILGGVGNFEEVFMPSRGAIGSTLRLFDSTTGLWSIHWASSLTGRLDTPMVGSFTGGVGTFYGDDVHNDSPVRVRFTWDQITRTTARWQQAFSADDDQWETNWIMELTRTPEAAAD
jgi:hypothetical protein